MRGRRELFRNYILHFHFFPDEFSKTNWPWKLIFSHVFCIFRPSRVKDNDTKSQRHQSLKLISSTPYLPLFAIWKQLTTVFLSTYYGHVWSMFCMWYRQFDYLRTHKIYFFLFTIVVLIYVRGGILKLCRFTVFRFFSLPPSLFPYPSPSFFLSVVEIRELWH